MTMIAFEAAIDLHRRRADKAEAQIAEAYRLLALVYDYAANPYADRTLRLRKIRDLTAPYATPNPERTT